MKRLVAVAVVIFLILPSFAHAEIKTITHTVQQPFGGSQSPDDARTAGIARAKREALERFGTYIESRTVVKDAQVDSDEIMALTAGVTKAEVVKQKNYTDGDGFGLEITVKVELDTTVLDKSLKRLLQDRNHLKDLTDARQREKKLLARIAELEKQNQQKGKTEKQKEVLKEEFKKTSQGLTAVDWFRKANSLWKVNKFDTPKKAIEYLTQAILLTPNYSKAYNARGIANANIQQYQLAIADFDQAIHFDSENVRAYNNRGIIYLKMQQYRQALDDFNHTIRAEPNSHQTYYNRGIVYNELGQYSDAISDYNYAIKIKPSFAPAYNNRGLAHAAIMEYQMALADYEQAILLAPDDPMVYNNRGLAYFNLGNYQQAISSYTQAIKLDAKYAVAYCNRADAYLNLGMHQKAINDYTRAINLNPTDAIQINSRGLTYLLSGITVRGCKDLNKACLLGFCDSYEAFKQKGLCK